MKTIELYRCEKCERSFADYEECRKHEEGCGSANLAEEIAKGIDKLLWQAREHNIKIRCMVASETSPSAAQYSYVSKSIEILPF